MDHVKSLENKMQFAADRDKAIKLASKLGPLCSIGAMNLGAEPLVLLMALSFILGKQQYDTLRKDATPEARKALAELVTLTIEEGYDAAKELDNA